MFGIKSKEEKSTPYCKPVLIAKYSPSDIQMKKIPSQRLLSPLTISRSISYYSLKKSFNIKNDKSELMKLFNKENDMQCWNCQELFSHEKVNWKPRKVGLKGDTPLGSAILTNLMREFEKNMGNKDAIASPNQVFGVDEYEYRGQCPKCNMEQCLFWFGEKSVKRNKKPVDVKEPFHCHECKNPIKRENQVWYSYRIQEDEKITEYLVTICPSCYAENGYPFEYNLEHGIIK